MAGFSIGGSGGGDEGRDIGPSWGAAGPFKPWAGRISLAKLGEALGLSRYGSPHINRIAAWAVAQPDLRLDDGAAVVAAYMADDANMVDQVRFFLRALTEGGYVKEDITTEEFGELAELMHEGWEQRVPASVMTAIDGLLLEAA